jgi:nucleotide-binding universal stress UspA family protein
MANVVLAAIDECEAADSVLSTATAFAPVFGATVEALHVRERDSPDVLGPARAAGVPILVVDGDPVGEIVVAQADPAVAVCVIAAGTDPTSADGEPVNGATVRAVLERGCGPIVVVPTEVGDVRPPRRALVPLDGTKESSAALAAPLRLLGAAGVELRGLHVFDPGTVPQFWQHSTYARKSTFAECVATACRHPQLDLRLRCGDRTPTVVAAAREGDVDLLVLHWTRDLSGPGAATLRATLHDARIPVLLVPAGRRRRR